MALDSSCLISWLAAGNDTCRKALMDVRSVSMLTSQLQSAYGSHGALELLQEVFSGGQGVATEGLIPLVQALLKAVEDRLDGSSSTTASASSQKDVGHR